MTPDQNGWNEYEKLVLSELATLKEGQSQMRSEITTVRVEVGQLKVKAGVWGAVAGVIPAVAAIAWQMMWGRKP